MEASLDQTLCRGDCICELICPQVFVLDEGGIAHVATNGGVLDGPEAWTKIPEEARALVLDAARECPAQAIFVRGADEGTAGVQR